MSRRAKRAGGAIAAERAGGASAAEGPAVKADGTPDGRGGARTPGPGKMTVQEAGRLGGHKGGKRGGLATKRKYGHEHYVAIGRKGGQRMRKLVEAGRAALAQQEAGDGES